MKFWMRSPICKAGRGRRARNTLFSAASEQLESRQLLAAFALLKDISPGATSSQISFESTFDKSFNVFVGGESKAYFLANNGLNGYQVWQTNGTTVGTTLLSQGLVNAGSTAGALANSASNQGIIHAAVTVGQVGQLVRTDLGTGADLVLNSGEQGTSRPIAPVNVVGDLVFGVRSAVMSGSDGELWVTDGTPAGTTLLSTGFMESSFGEFTTFQNRLFFSASLDHSQPRQLWKSDGTVTGTGRFVDGLYDVGSFAIFRNSLYFSATEWSVTRGSGFDSAVLWRLDEADGVPIKVQSINPAYRVQKLTVAGDHLYFQGTTSNPNVGDELWRSDGTNSGTVLVRDVNGNSTSTAFGEMVDINGTLFFVASHPEYGTELWRSNGASGDTRLVRDISPGTEASSITDLTNLNGQLFFSANGFLWRSDGTTAGTMPVSDFVDVLGTVKVNRLRAFDNKLIVAAENASVGRELFLFTPDPAPATPTWLAPAQSVTLTSQRPEFSWTGVGGAGGYEIWLRNRSTGADRFLVQSVNGPTFIPTADLGIGYFSAWIRTLGPQGAPASPWTTQPRNFRIKTAVIQGPVSINPIGGLPTLSWLPLAGASRYDIWIDRLDGTAAVAYRNTNAVETKIELASLSRGRYRAYVRGISADGLDGAWSLPQDFVITPVPVITAGFGPGTNPTPTLTWTSVNGAPSYEVYGLNLRSNSRAFLQQGIVGTSMVFPTLSTGPFRVWVRVTGSTLWSLPEDLDTTGRTTLLTPIGNTSGPRPLFSWKTVMNAQSYQLWVNRLGIQEKFIYRSDISSSGFTPTADLPKGSYRVWVRAVTGSPGTVLPWSEGVTFEIL